MGWHSQFGRILLIACFPSLTPAVTVRNLDRHPVLQATLSRVYHPKAAYDCEWNSYHTHIDTKYAAHTVYLSVLCGPQTKQG
jgi:hypothetical protein